MKRICKKGLSGFMAFMMMVSLFAGLPLTAYAASTWQTVGGTSIPLNNMYYTSMAVDSTGAPYVAYMDIDGAYKCTVMKYNGSSWETVGNACFSDGMVLLSSLVIDSSGTPYIAYKDDANGNKVTVMKLDGGTWAPVGSPGFSATAVTELSLALDSSGTPHVAYPDDANSQKATVMKYDGSNWVLVGSVPVSAGKAQGVSLVLDSHDIPYVAYTDYTATQENAIVMKYDGSSWVMVGNDYVSPALATNATLAIDSSDTPYVAYNSHESTYGGYVKKLNGSSWDVVGSDRFLIGNTIEISLTFDNTGTLYVGYQDGGYASVKKLDAGSWVSVGDDRFSGSVTPTGNAINVKMALDGSGNPYVAFRYNDYDTGVLKCTVMKYESAPSTYTVTYDGNGSMGGTVPSDSNTYAQSAAVTLLGNTGMLIKTGYTFAGWSTQANGGGTSYEANDTFSMGAADVTLYAVWTANTYTVTYNINDSDSGNPPTDGNSYNSGNNVTILGNTGNMVKAGYDFLGWSLNSGYDPASTYSVGDTFQITANKVLYAQWAESPAQTVTYDGNGATSGSEPVYYNSFVSGQPVTVRGNTGILARTGYTFVGWNTQANGGGTSYAAADTFAMGTANITLYAQWTADSQTIVYNSNGGSGTMSNTTGNTGATVTLTSNIFTQADYTFGGWNTVSNGSGTTYTDGQSITMPAGGLTLYAQWTAASQTIAYDSNGGTGTMADTTGITNATVTLTINTFTKAGYTFAGWNTAANGSGSTYSDGQSITMPTGGLTLYAQWTAASQTIAYDSNGGTGTMTDTTGNTDATVTLTSNAFTQAGYTFGGWNTVSNGSGTAYTDGQSITMPAGGLTLYAQWRPAFKYSYLISTYAGDGTNGYGGDGGLATAAQLKTPNKVALDSSGNLYIADANAHVIRKVDASTGNISTIAGTGNIGYSGDGGSATVADINTPYGVAVDSSGNVYISDSNANVIRKIDAITGNITTIAGTGTMGYSGDGGPATAATIRNPKDVTVDASGNVYIADYGNNVVRKINASNGNISTIAGTGTSGYSGDGGLATAAKLNQPMSVAVDNSGNIYIADSSNTVIRKIDATTQIISTVAGTGTTYGYSGDGGSALSAKFDFIEDIAVDNNGNLFITDSGNSVIRVIDADNEYIYTIAGMYNTWGHSGDGGPAIEAEMNYPAGLAIDSDGNIYVSEWSAHVVRKLVPQQHFVLYNSNGANTGGVPSDSAAYLPGAMAIVLANTGNLAKTGYTFVGWNTAADGSGTSYAAGTTLTMASANVTLYAQWTAQSSGTYSITGTVVNDKTIADNVSGADVKVMQGNTQVGTVGTTDANGLFTITGVPNGTYNLVVTKGTQIVTVYVVVKDSNYDFGSQYIMLPTGNKNSELSVTGSGTPDVVVDGLNALFNDTLSYGSADQTVVTNGGSVLIKLTVQKQDATAATGATAIQSLSGSQTIGMYLDMSLVKTVTDASSNSTDTTLSTVSSLLKIVIPYNLFGLSNVIIYRYHGGTAAAMTALGTTYLNTTPPSEGYVLDSSNNQIIIYAENFSTYAIAYGTASSGGSSSGGGSTTSSYTITVPSDLTGGSISPSGTVSMTKGDSKTFTIVPDEGYVISDVLVDGTSVGAVSSYTFSNITAAHTITAVFVKASGLPYYYDDNGNKVFISFASDDSGTMQYIAPAGETVLFQENPKYFTDIANHWGKTYIDFITEREIFVGTGSSTFSPDTGMTRAMFATVIGRLYEKSYGTLSITGTHSFTDCDYSSWYGDYIDWCAENGIIQGVGGSKFEPDRQVTRQEMAVILYRFAEFLNVAGSTTGTQLGYPDASSIADWATDAALYCQQNGIITGRDNGNFVPTGTATRAEVAAILQRFIVDVVE